MTAILSLPQYVNRQLKLIPLSSYIDGVNPLKLMILSHILSQPSLVKVMAWHLSGAKPLA